MVQVGAELAHSVKAKTTAVKALTKSDNSPVTIADMGIQAVAGALLERYFPSSRLMAEENSSVLQASHGEAHLKEIMEHVGSFMKGATPEKVCHWIDYGANVSGNSFWILDPIDGTKGFLRGGQYATALAFIDHGKVKLSALGCPELELPGYGELGKGVMLLAMLGKGCWAASLKNRERWERLRVSTCRDIAQARVLDSFELQHKNSATNLSIKKTLGILSDPIPMDSQAKHAVLAAGGAEIFFRALPGRDLLRREKIWDVAPGAFAIEEAGGRVTDLSGAVMDYSMGNVLERNPGFVATNGFFHDAVLESIRKIHPSF